MKSKKKYAEKFVGITPRDYEELEDRHKKVLDIFSRYKFERILDVGCGDGNFSVLLKEACKAKEVYGIEISEKGVEMARKNGVKCYQLDVDEEDFPFEDNYFDAVTAFELIEHLFDPDHFLDEVYRVLKPNGIFVLTTPNLASIHNRIALLFGYQPFPTSVSLRRDVGKVLHFPCGINPGRTHIRVFTLRSLRKLLRIHKFKVVEVKGSCAMLPKTSSKFFQALDLLFSYIPQLAYRIILISEVDKS